MVGDKLSKDRLWPDYGEIETGWKTEFGAENNENPLREDYVRFFSL